MKVVYSVTILLAFFLAAGWSAGSGLPIWAKKVMKIRGGKVQHVTSDEFFEEILATAVDKLIVIDFSATWCGPCKMIAPIYDQMSEEFANAIFLKVDVDEVPSLAEKFEVAAMPTFVFLKGGQTVDMFRGASVEQLRKSVTTHI